jgi:hypothetical protein
MSHTWEIRDAGQQRHPKPALSSKTPTWHRDAVLPENAIPELSRLAPYG